MDIQMQTPAAAALNAGTAQGAASEKSTATGGFGKTLQTVMQQGDQEATAENALLASLLQGLNPALLAMLLPQTSPAEGNPASSTEGADSSRLLEVLSTRPELLASLANSQAGQQWFAQAGELLAAMGKNPPNVMGKNPSNVMGKNPSVAEGITGANLSELQSFMKTFVNALHEEPDSVLLRQLADNFLQIGSPVAKSGSADNAPVDSLIASQLKASRPAAKTEEIEPAGTAAKNKELPHDRFLNFKVGTAVDFASPLNAMAAKSALVHQLAVGSTINGSELSAVNSTANQPLAEVLSLLNADAPHTGKEENTGQSITVPVQFGDLLKSVTGQNAPLSPAFTKHVSEQSFIQDMSQFVMKSLKVNPLSGTSEARLTLTPESLGQVDVRISMNNGQVVAHFVAQTLAGKEMLESQLPMLRQNLQQQGLQVHRLEVTQNSSLQSGMFQEQRHQQSSFQQSGKQNRSAFAGIEAVNEDFSNEMAGLINGHAAETGNSIDYTA